MSNFTGFSDADIHNVRNERANATCKIERQSVKSSVELHIPHPNNVHKTKECDDSAMVQDKSCKDFDDLQVKHKCMEEQNRLRRGQVEKALEDRTKKSQTEQKRLTEIQDELNKLDVNLSNDVRILRKQIDGASYEYTEAMKRFRRVEKEYLDAKLCLQRMLEQKEMLTAYLYTIIDRNEERKAEKLKDLLRKLKVIASESEIAELSTNS